MRIALRGVAVLVIGLLMVPAWAQQAASVEEILKSLRSGGYVIVLRHGATHPDQADTDPLNLDNVAKQRQLNDKGRADAKAVGDVLRTAGIRIGKSYSSRFQRAVETARLIGGKDPQTTLDITEGGQVVTPNENTRRAQALRKDWFEIREGEASIFKPEGNGKATLVGKVQITQWATAR